MILRSARVRNFKNISDSGEVAIEPDMTCIVGMNESGKTAFLEALYRLNPIPMGYPREFEGLRDFPRVRWHGEGWDEDDDYDAPRPTAVEASFELEDVDVALIEGELGAGAVNDRQLRVSKGYRNTQTWEIDLNEEAIIESLVRRFEVSPRIARGSLTLADLRARLEDDDNRDGAEEALLAALRVLSPEQRIAEALSSRLPRFLYFADYNELPGVIRIRDLRDTEAEHLSAPMRTALSLLRLARVTPERFMEEGYEPRRAELEAASTGISREVFKYWSQNDQLRVFFDIDRRTDLQGKLDPYLEIRIENRRHDVTLNFSERSNGFVWFFSFLTAFSEYRDSDEPIVLLLDEPGLGLHASAQNDLLRYIDEDLAKQRQVVYSTHSPFMVDPGKLDRTRAAEDKGDEGTKVSAELTEAGPETLFPLQVALGYELAQGLFAGSENLVVQGPSDYLYLQVLSGYLRDLGRTGLDDRWVIVPVGGLDRVPTFIALMGAEMNVTALVDSRSGGTEKLNSLIERGIVDADRALPLARVVGAPEADIEDLFEPGFYVKLVNDSGAASIAKPARGQRIVERIEDALGHGYDHYKPARHLLEKSGDLVTDLDDQTLDNFERMFSQLNALLD